MRLFYGLSLPDDVRRETARLALATENAFPGLSCGNSGTPFAPCNKITQ